MKKLIPILMMAFMMIGCHKQNQANNWRDYKTIEVDSCEYILITTSSGNRIYSDIIHKGNCRFCKQRQKQFYTEIIDSMFLMQD